MFPFIQVCKSMGTGNIPLGITLRYTGNPYMGSGSRDNDITTHFN